MVINPRRLSWRRAHPVLPRYAPVCVGLHDVTRHRPHSYARAPLLLPRETGKPPTLPLGESVNAFAVLKACADIPRNSPCSLSLSIYLSIHTVRLSSMYLTIPTIDPSPSPPHPSPTEITTREPSPPLPLDRIISSLVFESTRIVVASSSRLSHLLSLPPLLFGLPSPIIRRVNKFFQFPFFFPPKFKILSRKSDARDYPIVKIDLFANSSRIWSNFRRPIRSSSLKFSALNLWYDFFYASRTRCLVRNRRT